MYTSSTMASIFLIVSMMILIRCPVRSWKESVVMMRIRSWPRVSLISASRLRSSFLTPPESKAWMTWPNDACMSWSFSTISMISSAAFSVVRRTASSWSEALFSRASGSWSEAGRGLACLAVLISR